MLSPTLFSYLKVYVNEVRSLVQKDSDTSSSVFFSWNGLKLQSGQISTAIDAAWQKAGMEGHVSSTIFRKSTMTKVHEDHKDLRGDLADLMGHKTSTAEKEEACIEAANSLTSIVRENREPVSQPKTPATATKSLSQMSFKRDHLSWREEDVNTMKDLFSEEIKEKCITIEVVRNKIWDHPTLKQLNDKRVLDRIRSEWRNSDLADEEAAGTCSMPTTGLPVQRETLSDKMGCLKYERQLCKQTWN